MKKFLKKTQNPYELIPAYGISDRKSSGPCFIKLANGLLQLALGSAGIIQGGTDKLRQIQTRFNALAITPVLMVASLLCSSEGKKEELTLGQVKSCLAGELHTCVELCSRRCVQEGLRLR